MGSKSVEKPELAAGFDGRSEKPRKNE